VIRHRCDNAPCVNPSHLLEGTPEQNRADMVARRRAPWQRKRFTDGYERILWAVLSEWSRARGLDPYSAYQWMYGLAPWPPAVKDLVRTEFGLDVEAA